ncbi:RNA polymerase sigma factor [Neogemmobacter tilapiae]|uniref:RNA polymerase sigma factor n=1 Tax=Neogemmobacter tilapiae TaxID=875041 RepID=UPI001677879A|nr:sigma-70 family RNA polymerase sigma factor [Gemmobacter tilapiae]
MTRQKLIAHLIEERELLIGDAMRILGARDRAEDVVQEAALRCLDSRAIGPELGSARGLLRRMVRNLALDQLRRSARDSGGETEEPASPAPGPEQRCADREQLAVLMAGLQTLPLSHRRMFLDHRLGECRQVDIAAREGLSPARIHAIIAKSHARLLLAMGDHADNLVHVTTAFSNLT